MFYYIMAILRTTLSESPQWHNFVTKIGVGLTGVGSGSTVMIASTEKVVPPSLVEVWGATPDEWKVYGIMAGIVTAILGVIIQVVSVVLKYRYSKSH